MSRKFQFTSNIYELIDTLQYICNLHAHTYTLDVHPFSFVVLCMAFKMRVCSFHRTPLGRRIEVGAVVEAAAHTAAIAATKVAKSNDLIANFCMWHCLIAQSGPFRRSPLRSSSNHLCGHSYLLLTKRGVGRTLQSRCEARRHVGISAKLIALMLNCPEQIEVGKQKNESQWESWLI